MKVRSLHESATRYATKSAQAFLAGEQNLKWLSGVLRSSGIGQLELRAVLASLQSYGEPTRRQELLNWLETANW